MKFLILVSSLLATALASWEPIHEKYHGPLHYPKIHKGVPVEPAAVQHAREAHLKALSHASNDHGYSHQEHNEHFHEHHEDGHKWNGPLHYPKIHNGVPVEPKEVQHAKEAHLNAISHASHGHHEDDSYEHEDGHKWNGPLHHPKIYKGVPVEPKEVQKAREAHLSALSHASYEHHEDDQSYEHNIHHEDGHKWHGPLHYPKIYKGVPVEPKEVQHAREAHLNALSHAIHDNDDSYEHHGYSHYNEHTREDHEDGHKWRGPLHYPKIHNGVPVETPEVQHARAAHLKAVSENGYAKYSHNHYEIPKIGHDGKPLDTHEVEAAKSKHFAAIHKALAHNSHGTSHHYRKRRGAESYVHFSSKVGNEVPVYHHEIEESHHEDNAVKVHHGHHEHGYSYQQVHGHYEKEHDNHDSNEQHEHGYSYQQTHAPVYGHHDEHHDFNGQHEHGYSYHQTHSPVYGHQDEHHDNHNSNEQHEHGYSYHQTHAPVYGHHEDNEEERYDSNGYSHHQVHSPMYASHDEHHHHVNIPVIGHDGTPVDTPEVQHAREAHLAAHAAAKSKHY